MICFLKVQRRRGKNHFGHGERRLFRARAGGQLPNVERSQLLNTATDKNEQRPSGGMGPASMGRGRKKNESPSGQQHQQGAPACGHTLIHPKPYPDHAAALAACIADLQWAACSIDRSEFAPASRTQAAAPAYLFNGS